MINSGLIITNNNGQLLIGSMARSFLFWGKALLNGIIATSNQAGGFATFSYSISCPLPPFPFFTMPSTEYHAITLLRNIGGMNWEIQVTRSNSSTSPYNIPEVYIFCEARAFQDQLLNRKDGLQIYMSDGSLAFDSGFPPMALTESVIVYPPPEAISAVPSTGSLNLDSDLQLIGQPTQSGPTTLNSKYCLSNFDMFKPTESYIFPANLAIAGKPMYFYNSLAQTEKEYKFVSAESKCTYAHWVDYGYGFGTNICIITKTTEWESTYWSFYRSAIRRNGNDIECGWISVHHGCYWKEKTFTDAGIILGDLLGMNNSSTTGNGSWPYSNETLNLSAVPVLVGAAAAYD